MFNLKYIIFIIMLLLVNKVKAYEGSYKQLTKEELKNILTPIQYKVTQEGGTERPYNNKYWDNKEEGIYVDIISGEPLFSSTDKYKSGTGWPSFSKPIEGSAVEYKEDQKLFYKRIEVISKQAKSHLGHVFKDGPKSKGGYRYCMNSASLKFIPLKDLEKKGYKKYLKLFKRK